MNIRVFSALRSVNRRLKRRRKERAGEILSSVRRIEFVSPPTERVCAMTFDDGPTAAPCVPIVEGSAGLTAHLLDVLKKFNAQATFDVVGSTAENYPDEKGALHGHFVFGQRYDHYASFGQDDWAGALACPELLRRMVQEGHEIANHGYRHRIFGPEYMVYRRRVFQRSLAEVVEDLSRLHTLVREQTGYAIKLSRPPHYVDRIGRFGRDNAYTAYACMGYHYMAASADGGGWFPTCGDYAKDCENMVLPLRTLLERDPNSLSGAVIFQKDGYNMSMQSPVAGGLPLQLALLAEYGYRVVGVEALMRLSPFEDVSNHDDCLEAVRGLEERDFTLGFQNNTFKPDEPLTQEQLSAMMTPRSEWVARRRRDRTVLKPEETRKIIAARYGDCAPINGITRRNAAIALWECEKRLPPKKGVSDRQA